MRILILGGTRFLGRHLVEAALSRGHELTLFHRGSTNPELFPGVEKIHGDRTVDISALKGRTWDAVIDTCGYVPRVVSLSASQLADAAGHYTFISTISVYAPGLPPGINETSLLGHIQDETTEEVTGDSYGPLKVLCELAAERAMPGRVLVLRPGLIVGPHDPTDRFTYWPVRIHQGGEVLAPGNPNAPVQFIDVRDLAEWNIRLVEAHQAGIFNATGPDKLTTMSDLLETCQAESTTDTRLTWVDEAFILQKGVQPWMELPLWLPGEDDAGMMQADIRKALRSGLVFRPLLETVRDTLAWVSTRPASHAWKAGLPLSRESELLKEWHATIGE